MKKRNQCSRRVLIPIIGILATIATLLLLYYWIVFKVFAANAEPINQNVLIVSVTSTTTFETTETTQTTTISTTVTIPSETPTSITTSATTTTYKTTTTTEVTTTTIEIVEDVVIEKESEYVNYSLDSEYYEYNYSESEEDWPDNYFFYRGEILNSKLGTVMGPTGGAETYYNLPMDGVIEKMAQKGYHYDYWIRADGVKMYGKYIMLAANLDIYPRGTVLKTTLGLGLVCDTGIYIHEDPYQIDIAVNWKKI